MAGKSGGGAGGYFKQYAMWILGLGFGLAVLKMFDMDPLGVVGWFISTSWNIINNIADWFGGSKEFREIFKQPQG